MNLRLKSALTAVLLSTVAAAPIAAGFTMMTADAAYAKSDKAKDKGDRGNGRDKDRSVKGQKGKSGDRASRGGGGGNPFKALIDGVTGKGKTKSAAKSKAKKVERASTQVVSSSPAPSRPIKGSGMHPSELGNMNGALNSSPNAMLAHIRNGNVNGPVGHLALLATTGYAAEATQGVLDQQAEFDALGQALFDAGYLGEDYTAAEYDAALEEYYADRTRIDGIEPIEAIEAAESDAALAEALVAEGYLDEANADDADAVASALDAYKGELAVDGIEANASIDDAVTELGGTPDPEAPVAISDVAPTEDELAEADAAQVASEEAEAAILEFWNKNPGGEVAEDGTYTEAEADLLAALNEKIAATTTEEEIADAIAAAEAREADSEEGEGDDPESEGDVADCEAGTDTCVDEGDGELVLILD